MTRHESLAVSHWKEENSLTPFPHACHYKLGAVREISAVEYCRDGLCTNLGTTMQGMYTKIQLRSQDFTGYIPAQAGHKKENMTSSFIRIMVFSPCFPIHNANKKGIFTCYLDNEKLYCSCFEMCFPPKLLLCYIITAHLSQDQQHGNTFIYIKLW